MTAAGTSIVYEVDRLIQARGLLKHPYFQTWASLDGVHAIAVTVGAAG